MMVAIAAAAGAAAEVPLNVLKPAITKSMRVEARFAAMMYVVIERYLGLG